MATEYRYRDSSDVIQRKATLNASNHVEIQDSANTAIVDIEAHASRHAYGGADAIAGNALHFSQIDKILATSETTVAVSASSTAVISKGIHYARADTGVNIEYSTDGGTTWVALSAPCLIISDGSNVRFNNTGTTSANGYLISIS